MVKTLNLLICLLIGIHLPAQSSIHRDSIRYYLSQLDYDQLSGYTTKHLAKAITREDSLFLQIGEIESLSGKGQFKKVIEQSELVIAKGDIISDRLHFRVYELLIQTFLDKREIANAKQYYQTLLSYFPNSKFSTEKSRLEGMFAGHDGKHPKALAKLEAISATYNLNPNSSPHSKLKQINHWFLLGGSYRYTRQADKAKNVYQQILEVAEELPARKRAEIIAKVSYSLGVLAYDKGIYEEALPHYQKMLNYHLQVDTTKHYDRAKVLRAIAITHTKLFNYGKAQEFLLASLDARLKESDVFSISVADVYYSIGNNYAFLKEKETALKYLKKCLAIRDSLESGNAFKLGFTYAAIGSAIFNMADYPAALIEFKKAKEKMDLAFPKGNVYTVSIEGYIAATLTELGDYDAAIKMKYANIEKYRALGLEAHPNVPLNLLNIGIDYFYLKQYQKGLDITQSAVKHLLPEFEPTDWRVDPPVESYQDNPRVLDYLREKIRFLHKIYETEAKEEYLVRANALVDSLSQSIDLLRNHYSFNLSKLQLSSQHQDSYTVAIAVKKQLWEETKELPYLESAFHYTEKSKSMLLLEQLRRSKVLTNLPSSLQLKEKQLKEELLALEQRMKMDPDSLVNSLAAYGEKQLNNIQFLDSLQLAYPDYYNLIYNHETPRIKEIQHQLTNEEAFVAYHLGKRRIFSFVITKNTANLYQVTRDSTFNRILDEQIDILSTAKPNSKITFLQNSHQLYELLWKPFATTLQGKRVHIIRDGRLHFLPFELLVSSYNKESYYSASWLLKEHPITYQYSTSLWLRDQQKRGTNLPLKVLSIAPKFQFYNENILQQIRQVRSDETMLFGAKEEIETIFSNYQGAQLIGEVATKELFLESAADFGVIHIASHAFSENINNLNSRILFTADSTQAEKAILYAKDIYQLVLPNNEMTVLSACETLDGRLVEGEGILSLARAFFYAGSRSVVTTSWAAPDEQTRVLMQYFYEYLDKGWTKDRALQAAKIAYLENMKDEGYHPANWGGFVVVGNPAAINLAKKTSLIFWAAAGLIVFGLLWGWRRYTAST